MKIHPAADIFPMMSDEELADLAEDIRTNGLLHPIVVDAEKQVIDGRNRYAACKLAGVKPTFEELNGRDPLAYIAGANLRRRNLTKSQQAMALAKLYPEPEKGGRGKKNGPETGQFPKQRLSEARQVLSHSPALADQVLRGPLSLDEALKKVQEEETQANSDEAKLDRLRSSAPDLYELVMEERMKLAEAWRLWIDREEKRRQSYQSGVRSSEALPAAIVAHVQAIIGGEKSRGETDPPIPLTAEQLEIATGAIKLLEDFYRLREAGE